MGVDFSLSNLTFDGTNQCIHTLKEGQPNDYLECISRVNKAFNYFSRFQVALGFGARLGTVEDGPARGLFSMTGSLKNPFIVS